MTKKVLSIIPARGGSKGFPGKNIADLAGKPLITWTIEASLSSKYITKTVVSSDDDEILDISRNYGADTIKRPDDLASDTASSESVVKHTVDSLASNMERFDVLILLQPTSPLRTSVDIDNAMDIMFNSDATAVISVCEFDNKILKTFKENSDGFLEGITNNDFPFMRRQNFPRVFMPNGAIYIINTTVFLENYSLLTTKTKNYLMSKSKSLDIDTHSDLNYANKVLTGAFIE